MQETKDPKSTESAGAGTSAESKDPKSAATSDETLSDLEDKESVPEQGEVEKSESDSSAIPSPDGTFNDPRGGADDTGPM